MSKSKKIFDQIRLSLSSPIKSFDFSFFDMSNFINTWTHTNVGGIVHILFIREM